MFSLDDRETVPPRTLTLAVLVRSLYMHCVCPRFDTPGLTIKTTLGLRADAPLKFSDVIGPWHSTAVLTRTTSSLVSFLRDSGRSLHVMRSNRRPNFTFATECGKERVVKRSLMNSLHETKYMPAYSFDHCYRFPDDLIFSYPIFLFFCYFFLFTFRFFVSL